MSEYEPELGQFLFGNPTAEYAVDALGCACVEHILREIDRVFWNVNQEEWDRYRDPCIPGLEFRPYYWGDDDEVAALPNLAVAGVEIRWYKRPGRGMTVVSKMTAEAWRDWLNEAIAVVRATIQTDHGDTIEAQPRWMEVA